MPEESVKVFVRVRPLTEKEIAKNLPQFIFPDQEEKQINLQHIHGDKRKNKIFSFDDIFNEKAEQLTIFQKTSQTLAKEVLLGYNGTIVAYGQTNSGKTHTMMGNLKKDEEVGVIPRCFESLLESARQDQTKDFLIMCSFVELYNEELRDLLHLNDKNKLELRQSPEKGVFIKDLKKFPITSSLEMLKYLKIGHQNRTTGDTMMNSQSSRSHAIFTIYVESLQKNGEAADKCVGSKFNLVDLAGSERQSKTGSSGDRFLEATKINLSLTALGKVISALVEGKGTFIPYRDSKLTRLLQDSLGGNAKTVMIATISASYLHYEETLSTLKYASRAKYITNVPVINEDPKDALLKEYQSEIQRLKSTLCEMQKDDQPQMDLLKEENKRIAKEAEKDKKELIIKIKRLEEQLIFTPEQIHQRSQKDRESKLTLMEQNYKNLEDQVQQMKELLTELRKKYKKASKEIFQLENQHQKEQEIVKEEAQELNKQNLILKSVLNVLFTEKQLKNVIGLGVWETESKFKLPSFYFKDRNTLAFPCDDDESEFANECEISKDCGRGRSYDRHQVTATSFGAKVGGKSSSKGHLYSRKK